MDITISLNIFVYIISFLMSWQIFPGYFLYQITKKNFHTCLFVTKILGTSKKKTKTHKRMHVFLCGCFPRDVPLVVPYFCLGFWWTRVLASEGRPVQPVSQSGRASDGQRGTVQGEMAPSSKSEKDDSKQKSQRKHKDHVVKLLMRGKVGMHQQDLKRKV